MANTWPGMNSASLAAGPGARGGDWRRRKEDKRDEGRGKGGELGLTPPARSRSNKTSLCSRETRSTQNMKYLSGVGPCANVGLARARLGLVNWPGEIMFLSNLRRAAHGRGSGEQ